MMTHPSIPPVKVHRLGTQSIRRRCRLIAPTADDKNGTFKIGKYAIVILSEAKDLRR